MAPRFDQYFIAISTGDNFQAEIIELSVQHDSKSAPNLHKNLCSRKLKAMKFYCKVTTFCTNPILLTNAFIWLQKFSLTRKISFLAKKNGLHL